MKRREARKLEKGIDKIAKRMLMPSAAEILFGEHPVLRALKKKGKVIETGLCPIIDMRTK